VAPLKIALAAMAAPALSTATPARADPVERWRPHIEEASARFAIPVIWIERVMRAESGGRTALHGRPIVSRAGAMGLMQLMPGTWADMRRRLGLGSDSHLPRDNILAGTYYLRLMYDRFGYPGLFAAYNAGPARYAAWAEGRRRLPAETRAYLANVAGPGGVRPDAAPAPRVQPRPAILFALRHNTASAPDHGAAGSLFVPLQTTREGENGAPVTTPVSE
jgi:soluble lytic murein transglycosylase-like protein